MATVTFRRPPRSTAPPAEPAPIELPAVVRRPRGISRSTLEPVLRLLPVVAGAVVLSSMLATGARPAVAGAAAALYGVAMIGMFVVQAGRAADDRAVMLDADRARFASRLDRTRDQVRAAADAQRRAALDQHRPPDVLWTVPGTDRLWERRPGDADFAVVRVGLGPGPFDHRLADDSPGSPAVTAADQPDADGYAQSALRRFVRTHESVTSMPVTIDLRTVDDVYITGDLTAARALARSLVAQVLAWHAPVDVRVLAAVAPSAMPHWQCLKWTPHVHHPRACDAAGAVRLMATGAGALARVSAGAIDPGGSVDPGGTPASLVLVVCDGVDDVVPALLSIDPVPAVGVRVGDPAGRPGPRSVILDVSDRLRLVHGTLGEAVAPADLGVPDLLDEASASTLARALSPIRLARDDGAPALPAPDETTADRRDLLSLLGISDVLSFDVAGSWRHRSGPDRLRVPIGVDDRQRPVLLDLKDAGRGGSGPHGMVIGAAGSGKSELLRTLVLGLALTHPTDQVTFALVDVAGRGTFGGVASLPHVSAHVSDLDADPALADRLREVLTGELQRRHHLVRDAGVETRDEYESARVMGAPLEPLPTLVVVVDGFTELPWPAPDVVDAFLQAALAGRMLGVHLVLAAERFDPARWRGLEGALDFRIALRTETAAESRALLGTAAAAELPDRPGTGYLRTDGAAMVRITTAFVSAPIAARQSRGSGAKPARAAVVVYAAESPAAAAAPVARRSPTPTRGAPVGPPETLLDSAVSRIRGHASPVPRIWLPPLDQPAGLGSLLAAGDRRRLHVPVGLVDRPRMHRQEPFVLDLAGSRGHVGVVGAPGSGLSTTLRTLVCSLASTHTPVEAGCYLLDFGGGTLAGLDPLPHVGAVAGAVTGVDSDADGERVRRTVAEVAAALAAREVQFTELGLESLAEYRAGRADGSVPADRFPVDLFLVIDGWPQMCERFPGLVESVGQIVATGLDHGVHVAVSASDWNELPADLAGRLGSRIELTGGVARPGLGVTSEGNQLLVAAPRVDGRDGIDDLDAAQHDLVDRARAGWDGPAMAPVRLLPTNVPVAALPAVVNDGIVRRVPFAVDEARLAPVSFDALRQHGLIVLGGPGSGRSTALRMLLQGIQKRYGGGEAKLLAIDLRRALLGVVDAEHELGYAPSISAADPLVRDLVAALSVRLPGPEVTQQQLRDRSWWRGLEVFVAIDDLDQVLALAPQLLDPLVELVPHAADIGLHLLVARSAGGAERALGEDPLLRALRGIGSNTLVLSADPGDGPVLGVSIGSLPPGRGTWLRPGRLEGAVVQVANAGESADPGAPEPA